MRARAPAVYEWVARLWNARHSRLAPGAVTPADPAGSPAPTELPSGWGLLLDDIGQAYLPYLYHNASAFAARRPRFTLSIQGVTYKDLPTVQYRVYCRHELQRRFHELPAASRAQVEQTLARHGCLEPLLQGGVIASHYSEGHPPPYCRPHTPGPAERWLRTFTGIGWNPPGALGK